MKVCLEGTVKEQARFLAEVEQLETLRTNTVMRYLAWSVCPEGLVVLAEYLPGLCRSFLNPELRLMWQKFHI